MSILSGGVGLRSDLARFLILSGYQPKHKKGISKAVQAVLCMLGAQPRDEQGTVESQRGMVPGQGCLRGDDVTPDLTLRKQIGRGRVSGESPL